MSWPSPFPHAIRINSVFCNREHLKWIQHADAMFELCFLLQNNSTECPMMCYSFFPAIMFAVIHAERHSETCPIATNGVCGHRMSSWPVNGILKVQPHWKRWRLSCHWRRRAPRCSLGCIGPHRLPGTCQNWRWETRTESSSVPLSL